MAPSLRILLFTEGNMNHASTRIRAVKPMEFWSDTEVVFCPRSPLTPRNSRWNKIKFALEKRALRLKRAALLRQGNYDMVFSQRTSLSQQEINLIRKKKKPILFDFDDAIFLLSHRKTAAEDTARMVKAADLVVVSTEELATYCKGLGKNAHVLVSSVDTDLVQPTNHKNERMIVGWTGSPATTIYLDEYREAIKQMCSLPNVEFTTFGAAPRSWMKELNIINHSWSEEGELAFLKKLDVGIMPLTDDEWARGKGGYKLYLYMASGIPCLASPVGINGRVITHGKNGFLAHTNEDWVNYIRELSENSDLRQQLGKQGRLDAEEKFAMKKAAQTLKNWVDELTRK
jgi:glycosyltransferase involved in cell wall biosynthesis